MTPPKRITISAGIDQTTNSIRPSKDSSGLRPARGLDDLYHQANPKVARITGTTTTSMIAVELMRRRSSCDAIGPRGSSTPACRQEETSTAAHTTSQRSKPVRAVLREARRRAVAYQRYRELAEICAEARSVRDDAGHGRDHLDALAERRA